jgi:SAM-dependent methyltransferase
MAGADKRDLFMGTAKYYARYRPGYPEPFFAHIVERFRLDGTGRLLDLGCGTGQLALPLAGRFQEVVGMDPEPEMLAAAGARQGRRALAMSPGSKADPMICRRCSHSSAHSGW